MGLRWVAFNNSISYQIHAFDHIYPGNFWYYTDPRPNSDSENEKPKPVPASAGEVCYFLTQKMNAIRNSDAMECRDTLSYELVSGVFLKRYFHHGNYI